MFGDLGADPIESLEHETGEWAIRLLFATLAVTPLRRLTGWPVARFRRRLGLAAFAFVCVHFALWAGFDNGLDARVMLDDVAESPYVTVGFAAFLLLVPLAITSTRGWGRRLGRRWVQLHRLAYAAAVLAVIHFWWSVKEGDREPAVYAAILGGLFAARLAGRPRARPAVDRRS